MRNNDIKMNETDKVETISTLIKISIIVIVIIILGTMIIKRFVYFQPSKEFLPATKAYKDIIQGNLHGRLFEENPKNKIIVFCHGNAGNLCHRDNKINALCSLGYSVLIFDYSGYGQSKGVPNEQQCYDDASVFLSLIRRSHNPEDIIMYGESLGASVAIYVARRYSIPTVILESSLTSIKHVFKSKYKYLSFLSFLFPEFNTEHYLKGFNGRVLMMHSLMDEIVPYTSTLNMQNMVTKFIEIKGGHNTPQINWEEIKKFIEEK